MSAELKRLRLILRMAQRGDATPERLRDHWERFLTRLPAQPEATPETLCLAGVSAEKVVGDFRGGSRGIVVHLHGGAFTAGSAQTHRQLAYRLSLVSGAEVIVPEYRLAPEDPYPAALEDVVGLVEELFARGVSPGGLALTGDSAGAGLALSAVFCLRDRGQPLPAALVCLSPWVDLTCSGQSLNDKRQEDPLLTPQGLEIMARHYLQGADAAAAEVSPLFGSFDRFPPTLIQAGTSDILLDDARRLGDRMGSQGVDVELDVWPDMIHVWQLYAALLPEGEEALSRVGEFLRSHLQDRGGARAQ